MSPFSRPLITTLALLALGTAAGAQECEVPLIPAGAVASASKQVATSGDWLVMSGNEDIVVYRRVAGDWQQHQSLPTTATGSDCYRLALEGSLLAVGETTQPVRTFELQGSSWVQTGSLVDPQGHPHFGWDLALDGDWLAVGVPGDLRVELFERTAGGWSHRQSIHEPGAAWNFGLPVAMDSGRLAVGEQQLDGLRGAVYTFELVGGAWVPSGDARQPDAVPGDRFGCALAYDGNRLLVGARGRGGDAGAVFAFEQRPGGWRFLQELRGDPVPDALGLDLTVTPTHLVAAAPFNNFLAPDVGSVLLFERTAQGYDRVGYLYQQDLQAGTTFGTPLASGGSEVFVGGRAAPGLGAIYRLDLDCYLSGAANTFCPCSTGACGNLGTGTSGCANSAGPGATLAVDTGSFSASTDDLVLRASGLPPGSFGVVFLGELGSTNAPLGAGRLCLGAPYCRFPVRAVDAGGALLEGPGIRANAPSGCPHGPIAQFRTFGVQCWYRDPGGPCGEASNLTNGLAITLTL